MAPASILIIEDEPSLATALARVCQRLGWSAELRVADRTTPDCNTNTVPDGCDIAAGTSKDVNGNGVPDECDPCPEIDLDRLRAVPAWDIEYTRALDAVKRRRGLG